MTITASIQTQPTEVTNIHRIYGTNIIDSSLDRKTIKQSLKQVAQRGGFTLRDERLLEYLRELNVLSINQIKRLLWPSFMERTAYHRLNTLTKRYLLGRVRSPRIEMKSWQLTPGLIYTLGAGGRIWLRDEVSNDYVARRLKRSQVVHDLLTSELCVRLTEEVLGRGERWEVTVAGDRTARYYEKKASKPLIAPDALIVVRFQTTPNQAMKMPIFVEMDASREAHRQPSSDWGRKVGGYDSLSAIEWQTHPLLNDLDKFPRVLVVTHGKQRLLNLAESIIKHRRKPVVYHLGLWKDVIAGQDILTAPVWLIISPDGQIIGRDPEQRRPLIKSK